MNLILGIIVLIISVIIGYFLSEKYTKRRKFFCSFNDFNNNLRSQVGFEKNSLLKIINDKKTLKDDYYILMSQRINNQNEINLNYLKNDETRYIDFYFNQITTSDDQTLKKYMAENTEKIIKMYDLSVQEEKKYRSLYIKMAFLVGLIALIILL